MAFADQGGSENEPPVEVPFIPPHPEPGVVQPIEPEFGELENLDEPPHTGRTDENNADFESSPYETENDQTGQDEIVYCISCGMAFPSGTRFCDQDGTPLGDSDGAIGGNQATESDIAETWDDMSYGTQGVSPTLVKTGIAVALTVVLLGSLYWFGAFDRSAGGSGDDAAIAGLSGQPPGAPRLIGKYKSFIADQDIVLTFSGTEPKPLIAANGTIEYYNRINGGTCSASLVPAKGGGVGGIPDNSVRFRQQQIPGKPACPADIPVTAKVADQRVSSDAIVQKIDLEWSDPDSNKVLMRGSLLKEASNESR